MSHYENVPFEIPESWEWTKLENFVLAVTDGDHLPPPQALEGVPFLVISDVNTGVISFEKSRFVSEEYYRSLPNIRKATKGDLLFTVTGSYGIVVPVETERKFCFQRHIGLIKTIKCTSWISSVLQSNYVQTYCDKVATGTAQKTVSLGHLRDLLIPIPPLDEQERIVSQLDVLLDAVGKLQKSEKDLHQAIGQTKSKVLELAISGKLVPQDMNDEPASKLLMRINPNIQIPCDNPHYPFDIPQNWCWVKLGTLCSFLSRGKSPKYSEERKYPVFAQKCNLYNGDISLEQARFLDPNTLSKWDDKYKLQEGDVLMNSTGTGTVGRTRVFHSDCLGTYPFVVPDSHVSVIRTFDCIESKFIHAYLSSKDTQRYLEDNLAGSTNQKELYIGVLDNLLIPLPPQDEQKRIVAEIDRYFKALDRIKESLTA